MTTLAEKQNTQSGRESYASPSPTLAPSLRHSTEVQLHAQYKGTKQAIIVDWEPNDPENPMNWSVGYRRTLGVLIGLSAFCVAFSSSAYAAAIPGIMREFRPTLDVALLGLSLFVLGFGLGPLIWGPLSELYGRRTIFIISFFPYTLFHLGAGLSQNITTLLLMRLLGGCFGSSVFSVPGGSLADLFTKEERGPLALLVLAVSPLLGPVCGPLVGGFIAQSNITWRWNFWVMLIFSGVVFALYVAFVPETCHSVLLRKRAEKLQRGSTEDGVSYVSKHDTADRKSVLQTLGSTLTRPLGQPPYKE
ncbi:major facilitator superfamily transporter [Ceratobasidium sp. AG-Ba]|nr:major facilitator superfamily transporter [Ceratobasidium sp. AG-Ba]